MGLLWYVLAGVVVLGCHVWIWRSRRRPRPVIHMRGKVPGWFWSGRAWEICSSKYCDNHAAFMDSRMRMWCEMHCPPEQVERAVRDVKYGHADGECVIHGMDCPKPWGTP